MTSHKHNAGSGLAGRFSLFSGDILATFPVQIALASLPNLFDRKRPIFMIGTTGDFDDVEIGKEITSKPHDDTEELPAGTTFSG